MQIPAILSMADHVIPGLKTLGVPAGHLFGPVCVGHRSVAYQHVTACHAGMRVSNVQVLKEVDTDGALHRWGIDPMGGRASVVVCPDGTPQIMALLDYQIVGYVLLDMSGLSVYPTVHPTVHPDV
jgi:hypothetical protein